MCIRDRDRRAQRGRIHRGVGCEVRASAASPLQHRVVVGSLVPRRQALVGASKAHTPQDAELVPVVTARLAQQPLEHGMPVMSDE
eukprot:15450492-Alexandrium_andersonii.AAC.1